MGAVIKVSSPKMKFKGSVLTAGQTEKPTPAIGSRIKCTDKAFFTGKTERVTRVLLQMIGERVKESSYGLMDVLL